MSASCLGSCAVDGLVRQRGGRESLKSFRAEDVDLPRIDLSEDLPFRCEGPKCRYRLVGCLGRVAYVGVIGPSPDVLHSCRAKGSDNPPGLTTSDRSRRDPFGFLHDVLGRGGLGERGPRRDLEGPFEKVLVSVELRDRFGGEKVGPEVSGLGRSTRFNIPPTDSFTRNPILGP